MNYMKPEVVAVGSAVEAIQSAQQKGDLIVLDQSQKPASSAAYEADE